MIIRNESGARWLPARIDDFEEWQASLLEESARRLGAVLAPGGRIHRWGFVGSPVTFRGQCAWLRVSPFLEHEMSRKAWRGTAEAAAIEGVCKPALLHRIEWYADAPAPVPVSAEVLALVTDPLASRERFLRTAPDLSAAREVLRTRKPYTGCNAGITHFHADPHGRASICKVGRDPQADLITEGARGLTGDPASRRVPPLDMT